MPPTPPDQRAARPPLEHRPLWTYSDAAAYLNIPVGTLYAWVSQGSIPHIRLSRRTVRFRPADLEAWVARREVTGA